MSEEIEEVLATEAAVKLAEKHDIDLENVDGSGSGGNITKGDVEKYIAARDEEESETEETEEEDDAEEAETTEEVEDVPEDATIITYIGQGEDPPRVINFMGRQKFVRGKPTPVTDQSLLMKIADNPCFVEGEVSAEELHDSDEEAREAAEEQRAKDKAKNARFKKRHG